MENGGQLDEERVEQMDEVNAVLEPRDDMAVPQASEEPDQNGDGDTQAENVEQVAATTEGNNNEETEEE